MENSNTTTKKNNVGSGVLIRQQITNAYNEFLAMVATAISSNTYDDNGPVKVILFKDGTPSETCELEIEDSIIYVKCNFLRSVLYYDHNTLTFRAKGTVYFNNDFSFTNFDLEKNRQILEIVHAMYILKYAGASKQELAPLIRKYKNLTVDMDYDNSIDLSEIIVGQLDEVAYVEGDKNMSDIMTDDMTNNEVECETDSNENESC